MDWKQCNYLSTGDLIKTQQDINTMEYDTAVYTNLHV